MRVLQGTCIHYLPCSKGQINVCVLYSLLNSAVKMRCKSFLLLSLLLGVTLFHVNKVVCDNDDHPEETEAEQVEQDEEGKTRPRAPKTCIDEREAWMCPKGIPVWVYFVQVDALTAV